MPLQIVAAVPVATVVKIPTALNALQPALRAVCVLQMHHMDVLSVIVSREFTPAKGLA
jgi:hypothetical protein